MSKQGLIRYAFGLVGGSIAMGPVSTAHAAPLQIREIIVASSQSDASPRRSSRPHGHSTSSGTLETSVCWCAHSHRPSRIERCRRGGLKDRRARPSRRASFAAPSRI